MIGNFAADPGGVIEVEHLIGANMSFRRAALEAVGGIRDEYPGTGLREETDICLRVQAAGWRLCFAPEAIVHEHAAPHARGARFDLRYGYYFQRNHTVLLIRNFGLAAPITTRFATRLARELVRAPGAALGAARAGKPLRSALGPAVRAGVGVGGLAVGVVAGLGLVLAELRSVSGGSLAGPGASAGPASPPSPRT